MATVAPVTSVQVDGQKVVAKTTQGFDVFETATTDRSSLTTTNGTFFATPYHPNLRFSPSIV